MSIKPHGTQNYSMSPAKPTLMIEHIEKNDKLDLFEIESFPPFEREDFYIAHTKEYVDGFFDNIAPHRSSMMLDWSPEFVESVQYENSSLYFAIKHSIQNPDQISFSPSAGFHHAIPTRGTWFCTFSGQVIASKKIYDELGLSGAYIDLDAHFGNSIGDSVYFVKDLEKAIPVNLNPGGKGSYYIRSFKSLLERLRPMILNKEIHYLVWCHGADSTKMDDMVGQLSDKQWLKCSDIFYNFIKKIDKELGYSIPLSISLFGGYRKFRYYEVLDLHLNDLIKCHEILC
jgi:acetoin utilization deacetylase AcuC-like enzyme